MLSNIPYNTAWNHPTMSSYKSYIEELQRKPAMAILYTPLFVDALHALMLPAQVIRECLVQESGSL